LAEIGVFVDGYGEMEGESHAQQLKEGGERENGHVGLEILGL